MRRDDDCAWGGGAEGRGKGRGSLRARTHVEGQRGERSESGIKRGRREVEDRGREGEKERMC